MKPPVLFIKDKYIKHVFILHADKYKMKFYKKKWDAFVIIKFFMFEKAAKCVRAKCIYHYL